jgi:glutamine synthetase
VDIEQVLQLAHRESVESVDIKYTNLFGGLHHISMPVSLLTPKLFEIGVGFDGSSVPGFSQPGGSDLRLLPDPATVWIDPFWDARTISFIGQVRQTDRLTPLSFDPREIARKAEMCMVQSRIADQSIWGPEFEFYIFDAVHYENGISRAGYEIISGEADWGSSSRDGDNYAYPIPRKGGYHSAPPQDRYFNLRQRMTDLAGKANIEIKYHHHEVGSAGQSEIEILSEPLVLAGDHAVLLKYICKMAALSEGRCVTFMPKPLYNEAGSGMHFHQQLFKAGSPLFYDESGYAGLSQTALYYIGGLLAHGPALLGLTNPSTNSYKRLVPGFEAPVKAIFGLGNRAAAIRIPKYATDPMEKRMEFRPPDATCNVYLAMAAQLLAGLDGIKNQIDPTACGFGPYDTDVTKLPEHEKSKISSLPISLIEALHALEMDHEFLLAGEVFSEDLIQRWIKSKLDNDERQVRDRPHPYEMKLYFDA